MVSRAPREEKKRTNLEFTLVKDIDQLLRNELVETGKESLELVFNSFLNSPFGDEPVESLGQIEGLPRKRWEKNLLDIFLLVLVRNFDLLSSGFQIDRDRLSKAIVFCRKGVVEDVGNIVFPGKRNKGGP